MSTADTQGLVPVGRPTMDPLTTSERINEIAGALAKAQAKIEGAKKDSANPFFKSKYADLASVWEACREALTEQSVAVVQVPNGEGRRIPIKCFDKEDNPLPDGEGAEQRLTTLLVHSSGQWIGGTFVMVAGDVTPQAAGSCITYMRRYSLAALVGVAPEDDDGNGASSRKGGPVQRATGGGRGDQGDYDRARMDSAMAGEARGGRESAGPKGEPPSGESGGRTSRRSASSPATSDTVEVIDGKTGEVTKQPRVSADQLTEIGELAHRGRYTPPQLRKLVKDKFNVEGPEALGRGQAIDLIRRLRSKVDAASSAAGAVSEYAEPGSNG